MYPRKCQEGNPYSMTFFSAVAFSKVDLGNMTTVENLPYFLGYKTDFFSFQNNPKDLDPSYKTDLDL